MLMKEEPEGGIMAERNQGGGVERDRQSVSGSNKRCIVWGAVTVSRFHRVKTSSLFKGGLERKSHYLFISTASDRDIGVRMLPVLSITFLSTLCTCVCSGA